MLYSSSASNLNSTDQSASRPLLEEPTLTGLETSPSALLSDPDHEYLTNMVVQELDEIKSTIADLELVKDSMAKPEYTSSQVRVYPLISAHILLYLTQSFYFFALLHSHFSPASTRHIL